MKLRLFAFAAAALLAASPAAWAQAEGCASLPTHAALKEKLTAARKQANGGYDLDMWGVLVSRDGTICSVAHTGAAAGDQWPGSRLIAAQKAYAANAFSLPALGISTANLYSAVQPNGPLFGLINSNMLDATTAYSGSSSAFGTESDPLVGKRIGGIIAFGGGVPLYTSSGQLVGALGVSGDSSCADHHIAWRARNLLDLDYVPGGLSPDKKRLDNIVYDISSMTGKSKSGWGHPECGDSVKSIASALPETKGSKKQ